MKHTQLFASLLALLMMLAFTACGSGGSSGESGGNGTPSGASRPTSTVEPSSSKPEPSVVPPDDAQLLQDFTANHSQAFDYKTVEVFGAYETDSGLSVSARFTGDELVYDREPGYQDIVSAEMLYVGGEGNWTFSDMSAASTGYRLSPNTIGLIEGEHDEEGKFGEYTSYTIGSIADNASSFVITDFVWGKGDVRIEIPEIPVRMDYWIPAETAATQALFTPTDANPGRKNSPTFEFSRLISDATQGEYNSFVSAVYFYPNGKITFQCTLIDTTSALTTYHGLVLTLAE